MVVLRVHRRAASVPAGEPGVSEDTNLATQNSLLFSRAAIDNTDALSSASKRNDQQFLRDVNSLIGNSSFTHPYVKTIRKTHHSHTLGSPLGDRRRSIAVSSVLRPPVPLVDASDADVDYEVQLLAPITNRISRYGRATSVPPQPVTLTSTSLPIVTKPYVVYRDEFGYNHLGRPSLYPVDAADYYHTPSIYELQLQSHPTVTSSYVQKLNPVADLAVRQAHQNLDRIERELKSSGDTLITSRPTLPRTLVFTSYRDGPGSWRRSSSYHGPRSSTVRTRSPSPVSVAVPVRRTVSSTYSKAGAPTLSEAEILDYLPSSTLHRNIETDLLLAAAELDTHPTHVYRTKTDLPLSYSPSYTTYTTIPIPPPIPPAIERSLGWISGSAKKHTLDDLHLNGPDSYVLPSGILTSSLLKKVSTGTHAPVYIHSVSPDLHTLSLHTVSPHAITYTPSSYSTFTHAPLKPPIVPKKVAPIPPAQPTSSGFPTGLPHVTRPKVSETRRKVRDVLCKVKGDPHYFDD